MEAGRNTRSVTGNEYSDMTDDSAVVVPKTTIPRGWRRLRADELRKLGDCVRDVREDRWVPLIDERDFAKVKDTDLVIRLFDTKWHKHDGGDMPVHPQEVLDVKWRGDTEKVRGWRWISLIGTVREYRLHRKVEATQ